MDNCYDDVQGEGVLHETKPNVRYNRLPNGPADTFSYTAILLCQEE